MQVELRPSGVTLIHPVDRATSARRVRQALYRLALEREMARPHRPDLDVELAPPNYVFEEGQSNGVAH